MSVIETLPSIRYVTDRKGVKTDVLVPLSVWETLASAWDQLIEQIENQEDRVLLQEWLAQRARGEVQTISLDDLEKELITDGLLPG